MFQPAVTPPVSEGISPALRAAQAQLYSLRQQYQTSRSEDGSPKTAVSPRSDPTSLNTTPHHLPAHLGWESVPFTAVSRPPRLPAPEPALPLPHRLTPTPPIAPLPKRQATIQLDADIALGILRHKQTAVGRIWLLLRHLDKTGCGWVDRQQARQALTTRRSPLHVCGWRQLRHLLARGEGLFWQQTNGRIWLRSLIKVAVALDVSRLTGAPIDLPIAVLTQTIGTVRAHFYATFHSGRRRPKGASTPHPIARETVRNLSQLSYHTQRHYEKKAGIKRQFNFAIGPKLTQPEEQEKAWQYGHALFRLVDHKGQQGAPGTTYLAWQLPNSYDGPYTPQSRSRQRRLNRALTDLFNQGKTGNSKAVVEEPPCAKRYYSDGRQAAKTYNRGTTRAIYWQDQSTNGRYRRWHYLPGSTSP